MSVTKKKRQEGNKPTPVGSVNMSRPARILYLNMPNNRVVIVGFENFLSGSQIHEHFGEDVLDIYLDCPEHMLKMDTKDQEIIRIFRSPEPMAEIHPFQQITDIYAGLVLTNEDFGKLVKKVISLGSLLHEIIVMETSDIKTVDI